MFSDRSTAHLTVQQLVATATGTLQPVSTTARLDAELLLAHTLNWSRTRLLAERAYMPDISQIQVFQAFVQRRLNREPVAYIVGHRSFYGFDLLVDQRVLIPRPETEQLVERALEIAHRVWAHNDQHMRDRSIVDVGTGSGAIAIALAKRLPEVCIYALDICPAALVVAQSNLVRYQLNQRVQLLQGDLLLPLSCPVDMIVSNPPYTILSAIHDDVRQHEPHLALDGGTDGLAVYRRLFKQAPQWLNPGGVVLVEIGATQATAVSALARTVFPRAQIEVYHDLAGHDRIVALQTERS